MIARCRTSAEISQECCDLLSSHEAVICSHVSTLQSTRAAVRDALKKIDEADAADGKRITPREAASEAPAATPDEKSVGAVLQAASKAAYRVHHELVRISGEMARARSDLQCATRAWRDTRTDDQQRRGWVRSHTHVALLPISDEHVRVNEVLDAQGPAALYAQALQSPRAVAESLRLDRLNINAVKGLLRIRDVTTAEVCLEWEPPGRTDERPSTDPSEADESDAFTNKLHGDGAE